MPRKNQAKEKITEEENEKVINELLIIDGHAMAFRAYYAFAKQRLTNEQGMPTETIFGFFRMLIKLLKDRKPKYLLIVFDAPGPTFRSKIYPEYKANRASTPEDLKLQMDELIEMLKQCDIPVVIQKDVEADDVIASIVHREKIINKNNFIKIAIVSGDKDLFAILYPDVFMLRPKKGVSEFAVIDNDWLKEQMHLSIESVPDYMALTGDASDNVPGVKGIGEKTAQTLIKKYPNLNKIYENIDEISPAGVQKKLQISEENARLSLELVTLKKDLIIENKMEDFIFTYNETPYSMFIEKGFNQLGSEWKRLNTQVEKLEKPNSLAPHSSKTKADKNSKEGKDTREKSRQNIPENFEIVYQKKDWEKYEKRILQAQVFSFDTETTALDTVSAKLVGMSFCFFEGGAYVSLYIPAVPETLAYDNQLLKNIKAEEIPTQTESLSWVKNILENPKLIKVGQNLKFDRQIMMNHGVNMLAPFMDTLLLAYLINPSQRRLKLDLLSEQYIGHEMLSYEELVGKGKEAKLIYQIELERLARYAAEDAEVTYRLYEIFEKQVKNDDLDSLYKEIDLPLTDVLIEMEQNGIQIDTKILDELKSEYEVRLSKIEKEIYHLAGEEFLIGSTKELQRILFEKLGIYSNRKTDKGALSTAANVLESLRYDHPIIPLLLAWRSLGKLLNTYILTLPSYVSSVDNRVHTKFSQTTAATGRLASSDPNLQNIPVKDADSRAIRSAFVPEKGYSFLSFDYSQIELRILAHYSEDKNLVESYENEEDIHERASYMLFADCFNPIEKSWSRPSLDRHITTKIDKQILEQMKATPEFASFRKQAKVLNFSIVYGVTDFGLSSSLGVNRKEAKELISLYFEVFPGIKDYMEWAKNFAREHQYTENLFGRRRKIPDISSSNRFARQAAERLAINTPIQSTAADMLKKSMIKISQKIKENKLKSKMLLQIHDELLFEVPKEEEKIIQDIVVSEMENAISLKVPIKVQCASGRNWELAK